MTLLCLVYRLRIVVYCGSNAVLCCRETISGGSNYDSLMPRQWFVAGKILQFVGHFYG